MSTSRETTYNLAGGLPFFYQTMLWLVPETLIALVILLGLRNVLISLPLRILLCLAMLLAMELAKRHLYFANHAFRMWFAIISFAHRTIRLLAPLISYTLVYFLAVNTIVLVVRGANLTLAFDQSGAPLATSVLAFATAFLAIFIAGAAIIVELVASPYVSGMGPPFIRHPFFLSVLIASIGTLVLNLCLLRYGWNPPLLQASFTSGLLLVFALFYLLFLFFHYSNATNIIASYARHVQAYVRRAIPRIPEPINLLKPYTQPRPSLSEQLRPLFSIHILGIVPSVQDLLPLEVPKAISQDLKERLRPLFNSALRAIREDRRDILLASTSAISDIAKAYTHRRMNYPSDADDFLVFLVTESDILFVTAMESTNQQYTADLVDLISSIAFTTLELTEGFTDPTSNSLASIYGVQLADMALRSAHLHNTSAPPTAIDAVGNLAVLLMRQRAINSAVYGVIDPLSKNAEALAKVPGLWPAVLTQHSLHALTKSLAVLHQMAIDYPSFSDIYSQGISDSILKILRNAFAVDRDVASLNNITAPLVGPLWQSGNLVDLVALSLRKLPSDPREDRPRMIRLLSWLPLLLRVGGSYAVSANHASDFTAAISEITWLAIPAITSSESPADREAVQDFLRSLLAAGETIVSKVVKVEDNRDFDLFLRLSPTYAFLTHFSATSTNAALRQLLLDSVRRLLELFNVSPSGTQQTLARSELRRYLMMFGAWIHHCIPDESLSEDIAKTIAPDLASWQSMRFGFGGSEFRRMGYPTQGFVDTWFIFPSRIYSSQYKTLIEDELNDMTAYREYADFVADFAPPDDQGVNSPLTLE